MDNLNPWSPDPVKSPEEISKGPINQKVLDTQVPALNVKKKAPNTNQQPLSFRSKKEKYSYLYTQTFGASNRPLTLDGKSFDYFMEARSKHTVKCFELDGGRFVFFFDGNPHLPSEKKFSSLTATKVVLLPRSLALKSMRKTEKPPTSKKVNHNLFIWFMSLRPLSTIPIITELGSSPITTRTMIFK